MDAPDEVPEDAGRRRRAVLTVLGVGAALVLVAGLLWWAVQRDEEPAPPLAQTPTTSVTPTPTPTPTPEPVDPCAEQVRRGFVPTQLSVQGVVRGAEVRGLPRDANGVPGVPPVNDKEVFAWDLGGVEPGSRAGHVLLNTHTWPDGSAMGNRLLANLGEGDRLVLRDDEGRVACYQVTSQVEVEPTNPPEGWSATDGAPQVVIIVCSGVRRGPGDWSHRTLWFADRIDQQGNLTATS